jgi:cytochrome c biogenesis protein CcdA/thiol-disulfide isomerase/thioredoxin
MHTLSLALALFTAGILTILLPCILPLIPIVLGVSVAGRSKLRPLYITLGMVTGFVVFNFVIFLVLRSFPQIAEDIRQLTFYALLLFGIGFLIHDKRIQIGLAVVGGFLLLMDQSMAFLIGSLVFGVIAMFVGGMIATRIQQFGTVIQTDVRGSLGDENPITALIMGLTLGLVWVPCAGPALAFALTLVRQEPGIRAFVLLLVYAFGAGLPLLIIGYGGQYAVHSVRRLTPYTGLIKQISGAVLIIMAFALKFDWITSAQTYIADHTGYGDFATNVEQNLFSNQPPSSQISSSSAASISSISSVSSISSFSPSSPTSPSSPSSSTSMTATPSSLPKLARAPEFASTGPWLNSTPLTMASLKGKVVLIDFWTYSCINCIRTLPYVEAYAMKYKNTPFVLIGVHTPEFVFEQNTANVQAALKKYGLTYPVVQDNDYGTWNAFSNQYWPAHYLIDANGYIRYEHFGEGAYQETDDAIASLLGEIGAKGKDMAEPASSSPDSGPVSPETYVGERNWPVFENKQGDPSDAAITYTLPTNTLQLNDFALGGTWQLMTNGEYQQLQSDTGEIDMHFQGSEMNLFL